MSVDERTVGRSGLAISELTLGTWGLAEESYGPVRKERFDAVVEAALENGIRAFDTAPLWGDGAAEERIGELLAKREEACKIITRAGARRHEKKIERSFGSPFLIEQCERSLKRLQREQIDIWLLHDPSEKALREGEYEEAIAKLEDEGKIGLWGASITTATAATIAMDKGAQILVLPYNMLTPEAVQDVEDAAVRKGVGIIARSVLLYGLLAGQWSKNRLFNDKDHRSHRWTSDSFAKRLAHVDGLRGLVGKRHPDMATVALRFALSNATVSSTIIGARSPYQVSAAVEAAAEGARFDAEDFMTLAKVRRDLEF